MVMGASVFGCRRYRPKVTALLLLLPILSTFSLLQTNHLQSFKPIRPQTLISSSSSSSSSSRLLSTPTTHHEASTNNNLNRRSLLSQASILSTLLLTTPTPSKASSSSSLPPITHKIYFNVRISRSDGTFYVRDDETPDNKVYQGKLIMGLFGTVAPFAVSQFLKYVTAASYDPTSDNPLPSYGRSLFTRLDQSTGLLAGGYIPGLDVTVMGGGDAIRYYGRVLAAPLWIEKQQQPQPKLSHVQKGLLTHKLLDVSPTFGITTRSCPELDQTHSIFGMVLDEEGDGYEFLRKCEELPTYSVDRPASTSVERTAVEEMASNVFKNQRDIFRNVAKTFGDSRLEKVYEGKLLRRVDVTSVGVL